MFNKLSANYNKRHIYNFEDEPPEKKLVSDADMFIKQLAQKQRNTNTTVEEQLSLKRDFYKGSEFISLTNYTSGSSSLEEFALVMEHSDQIENLQSLGLSNDDITLLLDYTKRRENFKSKHKNMNEDVLQQKLKSIFEIINKSKLIEEKKLKLNRLETELALSTKPTSKETKLLKFALENQRKYTEVLPHPMDDIKQIEEKLSSDRITVNIKKIRRKARSLQKQIDTINMVTKVSEPPIKVKNNSFSENSKWDIKDEQTQTVVAEKIYSCKPQNFYTIKDGEIVKLNVVTPEKQFTGDKMSTEEIKQIPKFKDYTPGVPSSTLYLKNLANGITEDDLKNVFGWFTKETIQNIKIMKGKMRGQAFVDVKDEQAAQQILQLCNGAILKNKPIIIQFGRTTTLKS